MFHNHSSCKGGRGQTGKSPPCNAPERDCFFFSGQSLEQPGDACRTTERGTCLQGSIYLLRMRASCGCWMLYPMQKAEAAGRAPGLSRGSLKETWDVSPFFPRDLFPGFFLGLFLRFRSSGRNSCAARIIFFLYRNFFLTCQEKMCTSALARNTKTLPPPSDRLQPAPDAGSGSGPNSDLTRTAQRPACASPSVPLKNPGLEMTGSSQGQNSGTQSANPLCRQPETALPAARPQSDRIVLPFCQIPSS